MIDTRLRKELAPPLDWAARRLHAAGIRPGWLTAAGWLAGVGACGAAACRSWAVALVLWLANRLLDGLDGPVARIAGPTARGGFMDIVADFSIYAGFVVGVAVGVPSARLACVVLLSAYYCSGTAFLALSSLLGRRQADGADERSLRFVGGLAEGAETIAVYVLFCLMPHRAADIAWVFAAAVGVTALQRVWVATRLLGRPPLDLEAGIDGPARSGAVAASRDRDGGR